MIEIYFLFFSKSNLGLNNSSDASLGRFIYFYNPSKPGIEIYLASQKKVVEHHNDANKTYQITSIGRTMILIKKGHPLSNNTED